VDVKDDSAVIEVDLPEMLAALAESVTGRLKAEGVKLLEKRWAARSGVRKAAVFGSLALDRCRCLLRNMSRGNRC
jgi:hypothetical protein